VQQPRLEVGESGSDPGAELFTSIMENSLKQLNILPNNEDIEESVELNNYEEVTSTQAIEQLESLGLNPVLIGGEGKVTIQYPHEKTKLTKGSVVLLKTSGPTTLPNFTGWSKKMVLSFKMLSGLDIRINGDGYVTEQSLSQGTLAEADEPIVIQLKPPAEIYKPIEEQPEEESITGG
jgi:penicillin-binding protein 2B